jgi:predicted dehydrogenase
LAARQRTAQAGPDPLRVAFQGPATAAERALVHEAGGELVDSAGSADIVHVTVPPAAVLDVVDDVVGSGRSAVLHVRPDRLDPDVVARLAARAADSGVVVAVPFVRRYYPMVRLARRRVRSGMPGPLHLLHGWALRDGVAAWCDLVEFVSRHRVERVVATGVAATTIEPVEGAPETPGAMGLLFETDRGSVGTLAVSHTRPIEGGTLLMALDGVEESVVFHEGRPEVLDVIGPRSSQRFQRGIGADVSRYSTQPAGLLQGNRDCWAAFVGDAYAAVRGGAPDGLPTIADLARSSALAAAIRDSEANGTWSRVGSEADLDLLTTTEGTKA